MVERTLKNCHWSLVIGHWEIGGNWGIEEMGKWTTCKNPGTIRKTCI
jgi:hypothetical protein